MAVRWCHMCNGRIAEEQLVVECQICGARLHHNCVRKHWELFHSHVGPLPDGYSGGSADGSMHMDSMVVVESPETKSEPFDDPEAKSKFVHEADRQSSGGFVHEADRD